MPQVTIRHDKDTNAQEVTKRYSTQCTAHENPLFFETKSNRERKKCILPASSGMSVIMSGGFDGYLVCPRPKMLSDNQGWRSTPDPDNLGEQQEIFSVLTDYALVFE